MEIIISNWFFYLYLFYPLRVFVFEAIKSTWIKYIPYIVQCNSDSCHLECCPLQCCVLYVLRIVAALQIQFHVRCVVLYVVLLLFAGCRCRCEIKWIINIKKTHTQMQMEWHIIYRLGWKYCVFGSNGGRLQRDFNSIESRVCFVENLFFTHYKNM